jgi:hypothetical protein
LGSGVWSLGSEGWGCGFRVQGLGCRIEGLGFTKNGAGKGPHSFMIVCIPVWGLRFENCGFRISFLGGGVGLRHKGSRIRL